MTSKDEVQSPVNFECIEDIITANKLQGYYFFTKSTLLFFSSRIMPKVYKGKYFVTSERNVGYSPRAYTIREAKPGGGIRTIGEFQEFSTLREAKKAAKALK